MMKPLLTAAALSLALIGCSGGDTTGTTTGEPVAAVTAPPGSNWVETVVLTEDGGHRMGNPDAPIKLVEYGSRTCPTCAKFDEEGMGPMKEQFISTGKVSYEFREYPVHGVLDLAPSLLGTCVEPAAFFPMLDQMMANQSTFLDKTGSLPQDQLAAIQDQPAKVATVLAEQLGYLEFVKARGLSEPQARACLTDEARIKAFAANGERATNEFQVAGTPTFILNGNKIDANSWTGIRDALMAAGAR
ncbi:MAG: thioredoxin domain-containing protein [Novosphingopyxis baekryungensis]|nr:thioredoxin domain-containing protein [Novosphingopyxis baekryungensis]